MRLWLATVLLCLPLAGQPDPAESPAPSPELRLSGTADFGYRWVSGLAGNPEVYRSVVNLGEGPKLSAIDFTVRDPKKRLFDRLEARGQGWGGDPYSTARVSARREGIYDFSFDYRNIAYFNFLPSFANPLLEGGVLASQRAFDIRRRLADVQLELRPGTAVIPYLAYTRDSGSGRGITPFVAEGNEYASPTLLRDKTDRYRAGVRLELGRAHLTLEQGGALFKDDQRVFDTFLNPGNRATPLFGQRLLLNGLEQDYGIRGDTIFSKALLSASPASWADLHGQFLYSRPRTETRYNAAAAGHFVLLRSLLFYDGRAESASAEAKSPHVSGNVSVELRPLARVRIIEAWMTDRLHTASGGVFLERLLVAGQGQPQSSALGDRLIWNYNRQQVDVLVDATSRLTLRGGHRYVWGNARVRPAGPAGLRETGELRQQAGLAGLTFRAAQKLRMTADVEAGSSGASYFRTSLHDYQRARARVQYQAASSLSVAAGFSLLRNAKPIPSIDYEFLGRDASLSVQWTPAGRFSLLADYTRSTLRSDILYFAPQDLVRERSLYRENAHAATAAAEIPLPSYRGLQPRLSLGGSLLALSGSRPTRFYQPLARVSLPLHRNAAWFADWRWHGFAERFYAFENFRTHLFLTGLRLTR